jgi:hypothetical protein
MTLSTILNFARAQTQTDSNGLTDANGLIFANEALQDLHRRLVSKGVDASQLQEAYTDATAGQGTYFYPTDMLFLKAIELNYTDTNANNYMQANQIDVANIANQSSFSWLRGNTQRNFPKFDDRGNSFEVFPTPLATDNLSQLIRIFYFLKPTEYTSVNDTVNYPENLDTALLGWRIAASYLYSLGSAKIGDGDKFNAKYDERVKQYIGTLARGVQTPLQATPLQITGFEF